MEEKKSKILRGQIPTSVFYILFGLCLALMPVETVNVLCLSLIHISEPTRH